MKNLAYITILCMIFGACRSITHDIAKEKMIYGRWVTTDQLYNREWYNFKKDGSFADTRFLEMSDFNSNPKPLLFAISENKLFLKYRTIFNIRTTTHYQILNINDSTMVISTGASKPYPSQTYHLKKMKLNGKFISE
jgi:hypothetical protein